MMMLLDIIITHYKEPWDIGKPMFDLLAMQRGVDFGSFRVLLVNDGEENKLSDELFKDYPYEVKQINIPHAGVSAARNTGIENATSDWIMFCDFDDTFYGLYSLRDILTLLPNNDYDMVHGTLMVEDFIENKKGVLYISPERQDYVFIHGKIYRRAFLIEQNIWFDESLSFQEDSLFNATIIARTSHTRIGRMKTLAPLYVWIRRANSVTNSGREDEAVYGHFIRNLKATEENRQHREYESYCGMVTRTVYDTFYMINASNASESIKKKMLSEFIPWIRKRLSECWNVKEDTLNKIWDVAKYELCKKSIADSPDDVRKWLSEILS